jgi:hypothetical protein
MTGKITKAATTVKVGTSIQKARRLSLSSKDDASRFIGRGSTVEPDYSPQLVETKRTCPPQAEIPPFERGHRVSLKSLSLRERVRVRGIK